jgi:hypothetical protein
MNMTSRFTLGTALAGLIWTGCSSPAEEGTDPPTLPPPLANPGFGQGGTAAAPVTATPMAQGGSGQTAVVPAATGGSATVAGGGAGGAPMGVGGAGGAPGAIPTGTGTLIMHDAEGWVAGATNGVGIQGSFYAFGDFTATPTPGDTTAELDDFAASPTTACISGVASQVLTPAGAAGPAYGQYYGGGLGLNLADAGGMTGPGPWNRQTVTGFSFTLTGPAIPPGEQMRFKVTTFEGTAVNADGYCTEATPGANTFQFGALVNECWTGGAGAPALGAATPIVSLQWQVATITTASTPFDFCVENLTAITTP